MGQRNVLIKLFAPLLLLVFSGSHGKFEAIELCRLALHSRISPGDCGNVAGLIALLLAPVPARYRKVTNGAYGAISERDHIRMVWSCRRAVMLLLEKGLGRLFHRLPRAV